MGPTKPGQLNEANANSPDSQDDANGAWLLNLATAALAGGDSESADPHKDSLPPKFNSGLSGGDSWLGLDLQQRLRSGPSSEVYRAFDHELQEDVVVKISPVDAAGAAGHEFALLQSIHHPNLVRGLRQVEDEALHGLVLERLNGPNLREWIDQRGPCSVAETIAFALQVLAGLRAVRQAGFQHRDLKAQNVIRCASGRVVLIDLGLGQKVGAEPAALPFANSVPHSKTDEGSPQVKQSSSSTSRPEHLPDTALPARQTDRDGQTPDRAVVPGTPAYLPREVLHGAEHSEHSEVYSVGVLLYFLVTGRLPRRGQTLGELFVAHEQPTTTVFGSSLNLDPGLVAVLRHALTRDLAQRYPSIRDLEEALHDLQNQNRPTLTLPAPPTPLPTRPTRRVPLVTTALVVLTILTLVVANRCPF